VVVELYNQGDGFYSRVMYARGFETKRQARDHARWLAKELLKSYNIQVTDGLGETNFKFDDVWIPCKRDIDWGFDAVEDTINRDIRVVEVPL
jgi:hypothetical protein